MGVVGYSWGWIFNCVALNLLPGVLAICFVAVFSIFHIYVYYFEDVLVLAKKSSLMLLTQWWMVHKALDLSKLVMVFCSTWCYTVFICRIFFFWSGMPHFVIWDLNMLTLRLLLCSKYLIFYAKPECVCYDE